MASSGQIIDILSKLQKGTRETKLGERESRKEEAKQHKKLFTTTTKHLQKASAKAKKGAKLGNNLSMLASLTGMGLPFVVLAQVLGSTVGGKAGAKKAKKYLKDLDLLAGTKFREDIETFQEEVGSDAFGGALQEGLITGLTHGVGDKATKGIGESFKGAKKGIKTAGDWLKTTFPKKVTEEVVKEGAEKTVEEGARRSMLDFLKDKLGTLPKGKPSGAINKPDFTGVKESISEFAEKLPKMPDWLKAKPGVQGKPSYFEGEGGGLFQGFKGKTPIGGMKEGPIKKFLSSGQDSQILSRLLSTIYAEHQMAKRPSVYDYELPQSMANPQSGGLGFDPNLFGSMPIQQSQRGGESIPRYSPELMASLADEQGNIDQSHYYQKFNWEG